MTIHSQLKLEPCLARLGIMPEDKPSFIKEVYAVEDIDTLRKLLIDKERERQSVANDLDVAARLGLVISETNEAIQIKLAHLERENQELQDALVYAHDSFQSTTSNDYHNDTNYHNYDHTDFIEDERLQLTEELNQARRELTKFRNEMDGLSGQLNDMASEMVDSRDRVSLYAKRLAEVEHKLTTTREMNVNLQALLEKALTSQKQSSSTTSHLVKNIQSDLVRVVAENDQLRSRIAELEHQQIECEERLSTMVAQAKEYASLLEQAQNTIHNLSEPRLDDDDLLSNDMSSISQSSSNCDGNHGNKESEITKGAVFSVEFRQEMQKEIERNLNLRNEIRHRIITADNTNTTAEKKKTPQVGLKSLLADRDQGLLAASSSTSTTNSTATTTHAPISIKPKENALSTSPANPMNALRPANFLTGFSGFGNDHNNSIGLNGINSNSFMTRGRNRHSSPNHAAANNHNSRKTRSEQRYHKSTQPPLFHQKKPASPAPHSSNARRASPTRYQPSPSQNPTSASPTPLSHHAPSWTNSNPSTVNRPNENGTHPHHQRNIPNCDVPSPQDIPVTAAPPQFVELLVETYKNSEQFIAMKDSGNTSYLFQPLADSLQHCDDPCTWVQMVLFEMGDYFTTHKLRNRDLTPKFQRLLVQAICRGLELYLDAPLTLADLTVNNTTAATQQQQQQTTKDVPDLIVFTDNEAEDEEENDLIDLSFDDDVVDNDNGNNNNNDGDDDSDDSDDEDDDEDDDSDDDDDDDDVVVLDITTPSEQQPPHQSDDASSLTPNTHGNKPNEKEDAGGILSSTMTLHESTTPGSAEIQQQHQHPHSLTKKHQIAFVNMIRETEAPSIVYYAMEAFRVTHLLMAGGEYELNGSLLSRQLLRHGFYNEAISCIMRLHLQASFPMAQLAEFLFNVGQGAILSVYTKDRPILQYSLLSFINVQLRYNFAGNLGVVDAELLQDVEKDTALIPPLNRMRERRFQKELLNCGTKLIEQLGLPEDRYYFIWLSQRYASIRWVISSRSAQQSAENDYSINASSNYNGLLEMVADGGPTLAKLIIKELVDLQDIIGAQHFSAIFGQDTFFGFYQSLLPNQRMLGVIRGEQISHGLSSYHGKKRNGGGGGVNGELYYKLPDTIRYLIVNSEAGLDEMKKSLMLCKRCGLDSEWVPTLVQSGKVHTALMQIASDDGVVYLLDLKTLLKPMNHQLLKNAEYILQRVFESKSCMKLAYDFGGDLSLLGACMPSVKTWKINNFKDMNKLRHYSNNKLGSPITGGLAGVVMTFLGVSMNKKQQLSNWEKRPLTSEQITYAACDAYCLLEIYDVLSDQGHPFSEGVTFPPPKTIVPTFSMIDSPSSSTTATKATTSYMGVQETPSPHSSPSAIDLIQF
ncbi:hypothetical protein BCR42DRAFT_351437 [Absidia repens]|uniref:3'-5' exonuclease domain-containing protein n=1 Tax=Absidia repens TaxID=90262 RepID=A0A1X2IIU2_9FUNG|nr:hypothetical protein BCR42DRAFT_351437 [Absidia repens]